MDSNLAPTARTSGVGNRRLTVAVIGGSLTGPVTALLLLRAGIDVTVYEATPVSAPLGGGLIGLEHIALDVLDRLDIPQRDFVAYDSETIRQVAVRDRQPTHTVLRTYPGRNTTWPLLHRALAARLPAGVLRKGMRVTGLTHHAGPPILHFADGQTEPADLVVFADGRSSIGRRLLDPDRKLRYAGYVAHRGIATSIPQPDMRDFVRMEPCPGVQFNVAPVPGGCDWTFYLGCTPATYEQHFGAAPTRRVFALPQHITPAARAHVDEHADHLLPPDHAAVVHATATRMAVPVLDIDPPTRMVWPVGDGHAVLLGDALAPVRPHTARGANNGIEQAAGLAAALTQHRRYGANLPTALHGWQRRHLPTAVAAVQQGPVIGDKLGLGAR
ncbi:FAD-dependent monooxygenase [Plantactinospora sp. S1510]|uniref:FAD-dependent monooxygenase n=1 Tax=Plantactinospora alkalitolerans TaxID=2789879 RepID=A0ABS0H8E5_9ACTN|nr:FAD-dependent monooxygenase [Plantactinospora alkalitolerans]MBF9134734.1 FAD-dependent monooxygenase [Plantactinospora alkalitolerans]